jgi:hypothetical protein
MLEEEELKDAILLVFANKQDMKGALKAQDVSEALGLTTIRNRQWSIQETSATNGRGLFEGFDWYVRRLLRWLAHSLIHTYIHAYVHTYIHAYVHTYIRTYTHTYIHTYTYIYTYIHTYIIISFNGVYLAARVCVHYFLQVHVVDS